MRLFYQVCDSFTVPNIRRIRREVAVKWPCNIPTQYWHSAGTAWRSNSYQGMNFLLKIFVNSHIKQTYLQLDSLIL